MLSTIQPLTTEVVHLIAAGEVIDSLAAVVRELAENALDAGATRMTLTLWPEQGRVRLADNGRGMGWEDLQQAAAPHTTSKIHDRADLLHVTSLGFRGEALHSLAQLAALEICSRPSDQTAGWRVHYDAHGSAALTEPMAMAPGTIVTIADLFGNWPARRQALPALAQQLRAVQATIQDLALSHPQVTWIVRQQERPWLHIYPGATAQQILPQLLREVHASDLVDYTAPPPQALHLTLGRPDRCHRHRPDWVRVAVNGRMVRLPELEQAMIQHLRRTLPRDRFPVCLAHLQVPPLQVDWHRHPAKTDIYLQDLAGWQTQIQHAIDQALHLSASSLSNSVANSRSTQLLKAAEAAAGYSSNRHITPGVPDADPAQPLVPLRALTQVHQRYILAEYPTGMWLVEQHIAHERVLYEQLCDRWQLVTITPPLLLSQLTPAQVEQLQRLQMDIEPFGDSLWAVRSLPALLVDRDDCGDAVLELSQGDGLQTAQVAVACRSAIRNGMPLTLAEMQTLLDQWQRTRHPHTCPHGRPIYLSLEESSLARFFRRHWVIGKSHGI
jgi:DNA mismatch repair protein MutL